MGRIDIVIALDASGSITEEGFDVIKEFAVRLVKRIHAEAYDQDKVRLGAIMFGKGKLDEDRVVSDAVVADGMGSEDFEVVAKGINALKWQRGFTNMAQDCRKCTYDDYGWAPVFQVSNWPCGDESENCGTCHDRSCQAIPKAGKH